MARHRQKLPPSIVPLNTLRRNEYRMKSPHNLLVILSALLLCADMSAPPRAAEAMTQPSPTPSASIQPPANEPLFADWAAPGARRLRSALFYIEGGNIRYGSLGVLYNANDYFGFGLRGGVDSAKPYYDILPYLAGNLRLYTNPHALAGFLDLDLGLRPTLSGSLLTSTGRVGLEYRSFQTGLTLTLSGGVTANPTGPGYPLAGIRPEADLAVGWAF